jgi:ELWxxDGT repeat protein
MSARERRAKERRQQQRTLARVAAPVAVSGLLFATAVAGTPASAEATTLSVSQVANINTLGADSDPTEITTVGGAAYFSAYKPGVGTEMWKSDGTAGGTTLVDDIFPGPGGSYPTELTNVGGTLFFTANDGSGSQLWTTDGTAAGTTALTSPDTNQGQYPHCLINAAGTLYFIDDGHVWKSDGTSAGTVELTAATPTTNYLTAVGGTVYFTDFNSAVNQLWKTDGTSAGTTEVAALPAATTSDMGDVSGTLYFGIDSQSTGLQLWKSDGTSAGTTEVKQIGSASQAYPAMGDLTNLGGTLVFAANDGSAVELWRSDGTSMGTQALATVTPDGYMYAASELTAASGKLYFLARNSQSGATQQLWETDGTVGGTVEVSDLSAHGSYFQGLTAVGNTLFFFSDSGSGLMSDDGVPGDAVDVLGPSYADSLTNLQGTLLFAGNDGTHGTALWRSDGTSAGTSMVVNVDPGNAGSYPYDFVNFGGTVYFLANDGTHEGLWKSDGSSIGTTLVVDLPGSPGNYPDQIVSLNGELYFTANGQLYKSSGATGDITAVTNPAGAEGVEDVTVAGNSLFFYARTTSNGWGLWKSDGSTIVLVDGSGVGSLTTGGGYLAGDYPLVAAGGTVYFSATDGTHGWELWKSDGTTSGTQLVDDIDPGSAGGDPQNLTNLNGIMYFTADDGTHGDELWKSDGSASGTLMVDDIDPGSGGSYPDELTNVGGTLFFDAQTPGGQWAVWKSDGTQAGTQALTDTAANGLTEFDGELYFAAGGPCGTQLWKSDGTAAGTQLVSALDSANGGDCAAAFTNFNGTLVFVTNDGTHGHELWQSDGTASGTYQVADINPGPATGVEAFSRYGSALLPVGGNLFFAGNDGTNGFELWKATIASANGGGGSGSGGSGAGTGSGGGGGPGGPPPPPSNGIPPTLKFTSTKVSGDDATIQLTLPGTSTGSYTVNVTLSVVETLQGNKVLGVAASDRTAYKAKKKPVKKTVVVGTKTVQVSGGKTVSLSVALNAAGKKLLALRHHLSVKLAASAKGKTLASKTLSFTAAKKKPK